MDKPNVPLFLFTLKTSYLKLSLDPLNKRELAPVFKFTPSPLLTIEPSPSVCSLKGTSITPPLKSLPPDRLFVVIACPLLFEAASIST